MWIQAKLSRANFLINCAVFVVAFVLGIATASAQDSPQNAEWQFQLRYRTETSPSSGRFHTLLREETWQPTKTAIIVCDVWDTHHSINAVRRVEEIAPRIDAVLKHARAQGATIIHAPSDCMDSYTEHPARHRAMNVSVALQLPTGIKEWRSRIDSEKSAVYPIDQSDGGSDDDPAENAVWAKQMESQGRNPGTPWKAQSPLIAIESDLDFISDKGDEVWSILQSRSIENVILVGVHTNMCVLGRPFGLRNVVAAGKRVALLRDLTDTMYNPQRWPFVNHHTGTDRIIEYIEKYVCPTLTSDQFIGGKPLRFESDDRPLVAIVMAEDEYGTNQTLPQFAQDYLGHDFRVALVFASDGNPIEIPGLEVLDEADAVIISVRRRPLASQQMAIIRRFVESGKPVLGIRTASHAFALRNAAPANGLDVWPEFDAQVFGGNYTDHHGNAELPTINVDSGNASHPIFTGIDASAFSAGGSLYKTTPLASTAQVLLRGSINGHPPEPVAWVFEREGGGRSFYSSLGHNEDFENAAFTQLLFNSLCWATSRKIRQGATALSLENSIDTHWRVVTVPAQSTGDSTAIDDAKNGPGWYRCYFKLEREDELILVELKYADATADATVWINGQKATILDGRENRRVVVPKGCVVPGELNLLVICFKRDNSGNSFAAAPVLKLKERVISLAGPWQFRVGNDPSLSSLPLPPKFAASPDVIFE